MVGIDVHLEVKYWIICNSVSWIVNALRNLLSFYLIQYCIEISRRENVLKN